METITITKEAFDLIKDLLEEKIKENCDFCGCKIDSDSFGYISRDVTCCNFIECILESTKDNKPNKASYYRPRMENFEK